MYQRLGGKKSFSIFSIGALVTCVAHIILRPANKCTHHQKHTDKSAELQNDVKQSKYPESDMQELELLQKKNERNDIAIVTKS